MGKANNRIKSGIAHKNNHYDGRKIECADHKGIIYRSIAEKCQVYGISQGTYYHRKQAGWTERSALTTPVKHSAYGSIRALALKNEIPYPTLYQYMTREGLSLEDALKKHKSNQFLAPDGNYYKNKKEYCEKIGISPRKVYQRTARGISDVAKLYNDNYCNNRFSVADYLGNEWPSEKEMCRHYPVKKASIYSERIKMGWPQKCALVKPARGTAVKWEDTKGHGFCTYKEMSSFSGIPESVIRRRLKYGATVDEAIYTPYVPQNHHVTDPNGMEYKSESKMCEAWGQKYKYYSYCKRKGLSLIECLTKNTLDLSITDFAGNIWQSERQMLKYYAISYKMYKKRINKGWSQKDALLTPSRRIPAQDRIGEKALTSCGMTVEIIKIDRCSRKNVTTFTVQFEDEARVLGVVYNAFVKGTVHHPGLSRNGKCGTIAGFSAKRISRTDENVYYRCKCLYCKDAKEDILSARQMVTHWRKMHGSAKEK